MGRISSTLLRNGVIFIGGTAKTEKSVFRGAFSNVCGTFCGTEVPFASGTLKFDSCPRGGGEKVTNSSCLRDAKKCRPIRSGHFSGACTGCGRTLFFSFWDPAPGDCIPLCLWEMLELLFQDPFRRMEISVGARCRLLAPARPGQGSGGVCP